MSQRPLLSARTKPDLPLSSEKNPSFSPLKMQDPNYAETDIISKINTIIGELKGLEENFLRIRQDLLKQTTLEGRENSKICAVQAKFIFNKKKHYKSIEEDIELLSKTFQEQFKRINEEISSISALSKKRVGCNSGPTGESPIIIRNQSLKVFDFPTLKLTKSSHLKISSILKEKIPVTFTVKAEPSQEPKPKLFNVKKARILEKRTLQSSSAGVLKTITKVNESKHISFNALPPEEKHNYAEDLDQSSLENDIEKETLFKKEDSFLFKEDTSDLTLDKLKENLINASSRLSFLSVAESQREYGSEKETLLKL